MFVTWVTARIFEVVSGACTTSSDQLCFASPNYPANYGVSQTCTISVRDMVILSVTAFELESGYDNLTVNGIGYTASAGPEGVEVGAGSSITFGSDGSNTRKGFYMCGTSGAHAFYGAHW